MMAVTVRTDPDFDNDPPRPLFEDNGYVPDQFGNQNYDVSPDGRRFVMVKSSGSITGRHRINIVLDWFQELTERVPVN